MRCHSAERMISRRMSSALPPDAATALELHLASCSQCRREQELLADAWRALDALAAPGEAPDDWGRIEAALEGRCGRWRPSWWGWDLAAGGAARAWVLVGMMVIGAGGGVLLARPLLPRVHPPLEAAAFAEILGELPWDSPAMRLDRAFDAREREEGKR